MPYFSIIMPVFNGEKYVKRAIKSVQNQSFSDFELLIIDDGSKDNSARICQSICQTDPRVKLIVQNNKGALLARKSGIRMATGIYTLFLDCDDTFLPDALDVIYREVQKQKVDLLVFNYYKFTSQKKMKLGKQILSEKKVYTGQSLAELSVEYFGELNSLWTKAVKTEIAKKAFRIYDCRLSMAEDYLISLQIFRYIHNAAYIDKYLYNYIDNPNSSMHNVKKEFFGEYEFVYKEALKVFNDFKLSTEIKNKLKEHILMKIFADYFFYTFQKKLSFQEFLKLGELIRKKEYMNCRECDLNLGFVWKPIYKLIKSQDYHSLYLYFLLLQLGYFAKHRKFAA